MTVSPGVRTADPVEGGRGERTRALILESSRRLFLERGYAGTPINAITEACGISRAAFYTYFKDKREVFNGECGAESGTIPVSAIAPAMLVSEIETQRQQQGTARPPILPPPTAAKAGEGN